MPHNETTTDKTFSILILNSESFEDFFKKNGIIDRRKALIILLEYLQTLQKEKGSINIT